MALRLSSPGINVREVDLTRGGVNASVNIAAGIAGPFQQGPVNEVTRITTEKELVEVFGGPGAGLTDYHYETWYAVLTSCLMVVSSMSSEQMAPV